MLKKRSSLTFYETPPNIEDETSETISLPTKIAIQSLSEELRQVIILRYFADMTIKETAAFLDVPEGTVSTRARKALTVLRIELMDEEGGNLNEEKS
jgi:RNA polymerase sigma-70 factor (ECF subfamily)